MGGDGGPHRDPVDGLFTESARRGEAPRAGARKVPSSAPASDPDATACSVSTRPRGRPGDRTTRSRTRRCTTNCSRSREGAQRGGRDRARLRRRRSTRTRPTRACSTRRTGTCARARGGINLIPPPPARRGDRPGDPPEGQARRHADARTGADRVDRRPDGRGAPGDDVEEIKDAPRRWCGELARRASLPCTDEPIVSSGIRPRSPSRRSSTRC